MIKEVLGGLVQAHHPGPPKAFPLPETPHIPLPIPWVPVGLFLTHQVPADHFTLPPNAHRP